MPTEKPHDEADQGQRPSLDVDRGNIPEAAQKRERRSDEVVLRDFDKIQEKTPITVEPTHLKMAVVGVLALIALAVVAGWLIGRSPTPASRPAQVVVAGKSSQNHAPETTGTAGTNAAAGIAVTNENNKTPDEKAGTQPDDSDEDEGHENHAVTASILPLPVPLPVPVPAPVPTPVPVPAPTQKTVPTPGPSPKARGVIVAATERRNSVNLKEIEKALKIAAEAAERAQFQFWPPLAVTSCDYSCIAVDGECMPPKPPVKIPAPIPAKTAPAQPEPVKPVSVEATALKTAPVKPVSTEVASTKPLPTKPVPTTTTATKPVPAKPEPSKTVAAKPTPTKPVPAKPVKDLEQKKYSVQVRSFKEKELAEQHADLLKSKGYNPYVVTFTDPSGIEWFRVRVGKFDNSTDASTFARELNAKEAEQAIPVEAK